MTTPPVHRPRARRSSGLRRLAALGVAGAFLLFVTSCTQSGQPDANLGTGPTVLGVFEFEFGGFGSGEIHASVRRLDLEEGIGASELGTAPVGGIGVTASTIGSGATACGGVDYLFSVYDVTTPASLTGVTFVGYASQGFSLEGSAFAEVAEQAAPGVAGDRIPGASTITPSIGGVVDCVAGVPALTNPQDLATVVYDTGEISLLDGALSALAFVETVFPYGFVASNGDSRTLANTGQLKLGFRVPTGVELVRWRAVAIIDDAHRLALPVEFDARDVGGTDNLAEFLGQAGRISQANEVEVAGVMVNSTVEAVVMGEGDRALVTIDANDWIDGTTLDLSILDLIVVPDVRLAGPSTSATSYWIGEGSANALTSDFIEFAVQFKTPETPYSFVPPEGAELIVGAIGGGGAGGGRTQNGAGGGGGGGAFAGDTVTGASGPYAVAVGAGGLASTGSGLAGVASTFGPGPIVSAAGGGGGGGGNANTAGLGGSGSTGTTTYVGGNGSAGGAVGAIGTVGAGGGAAGTTGDGGSAAGATGGTGTALYGGNGGNGPTVSRDVGLPGLAFGGGGGAGARQSADVVGGNGAPGIVVVRYAVP